MDIELLNDTTKTLSEISCITGHTYRACATMSNRLGLPDRRRITETLIRRCKTRYNEHTAKYPIVLSSQQKSLLVGSVLGDASLIPTGGKFISNAYYSCSHCKKQFWYLFHKYEVMKPFSNKINDYYARCLNNKYETYNFYTVTHPIFRSYYDLFYNNRKVVPYDIENVIDTDSICYWILDDGSLHINKNGSPYYRIHSMSFSKKENNILQNVLKSFDIQSSISPVNRGFGFMLCIYSNSAYIVSELLLDLINRYKCLDCMRYKIIGGDV